MSKPTLLIVGKLPPPYIGPAIATSIILNSTLKEEFNLLHLNTKVNESIGDFGKGGVGKLFKNISIYFRLIKLLKSSKVDVILIPFSQTTLGFLKDSIFILIASGFSTKILLQLRGSNFKNWMKNATSLTEKYVRFCFNKTNGMIVLGENLRHLFEDFYSSDQIYVVPNGCNISITKRNKNSTKIQLLYFSNFLPSKGIKEVLEALVILQKKGIDTFEMTAVGAWDDFDFRDRCLAFVEENELPVKFHNPQSGEDKWNSFADADVFVFTPNQPEGHPWSIIEALAASLPIISTDQGAIIESVMNNENGFIVEKKSVEQIAEKLKMLADNKELRKKMGQKSLAHYKNHFTEKKMVENLTKTYRKVLNIEN